MGNGFTCIINCNYRIAATLYTLETRFVQVCNRKYLANNNNNNNNNNVIKHKGNKSDILT